MKNLTFLFAIAVIFTAGCNDTKPEQTEPETEPVELKLDHNRIDLQFEPSGYAKEVYYPDITPEGYDVTIHILQGNGGYQVVKTYDRNTEYPGSAITTEARIVDDNIVFTLKGLLPEEETQENYNSFVCWDVYRVTDSKGMYQNITIRSSWLDGILL